MGSANDAEKARSVFLRTKTFIPKSVDVQYMFAEFEEQQSEIVAAESIYLQIVQEGS